VSARGTFQQMSRLERAAAAAGSDVSACEAVCSSLAALLNEDGAAAAPIVVRLLGGGLGAGCRARGLEDSRRAPRCRHVLGAGSQPSGLGSAVHLARRKRCRRSGRGQEILAGTARTRVPCTEAAVQLPAVRASSGLAAAGALAILKCLSSCSASSSKVPEFPVHIFLSPTT